MSTAEFEAERARLFQIAYGMLGSVASAEDVLQEAWIRFDRTEGIDNPAAWLRTVVSRLALDELRSARSKREVYPGPWLPEPVPTDGPDPVELAESLSMAALVVMEQLSPAERAAFLLREVFEVDYSEVAALLERSEPATRQLVRRAREHLRANRPRFDADPTHHAALLARFAAASTSGDLDALKSLLTEDVTFTSDGGGKVSAATRVVRGSDRVARMIIGLGAKGPADLTFAFRVLNRQPAVILSRADPTAEHPLYSVVVFTIVGGRVAALHTVRNPEKLAHLR